MTIEAIQAEVLEFAAAREWQRFHDPKNLAMALGSEVGELAAIFRWVPNDDSDVMLDDAMVLERVADEIGDVAILLLLLCRRTGIDLEEAIRRKLERNSTNYPLETSRGGAQRP